MLLIQLDNASQEEKGGEWRANRERSESESSVNRERMKWQSRANRVRIESESQPDRERIKRLEKESRATHDRSKANGERERLENEWGAHRERTERERKNRLTQSNKGSVLMSIMSTYLTSLPTPKGWGWGCGRRGGAPGLKGRKGWLGVCHGGNGRSSGESRANEPC
jgi:hypothetical protein